MQKNAKRRAVIKNVAIKSVTQWNPKKKPMT